MQQISIKTSQLKVASLITKWGRVLLSFLYSSVHIEGAFSQLKLIKNERRTNLSNECRVCS